MRLIFDTNVLIDYCFKDRSDISTDSLQMIYVATECGHTCLAPVNIVNDFTYIINTILKRDKEIQDSSIRNQIIWGFFDKIKDVVGFVGCDVSDIFVAEKFRFDNCDMEDNLVVAAAMRCGADYLITNDKDLNKKQLVPTKTPKQMIKILSKKK